MLHLILYNCQLFTFLCLGPITSPCLYTVGQSFTTGIGTIALHFEGYKLKWLLRITTGIHQIYTQRSIVLHFEGYKQQIIEVVTTGTHRMYTQRSGVCSC